MKVDNINYQSIWLDESDQTIVRVIDQQKLPFFFEIKDLRSVDDVFFAIKNMTLRGAPVIGAAGAFGIYFATLELTSISNIHDHLSNAARYLKSSRPTAVNLSWAINKVMETLAKDLTIESLSDRALKAAVDICEQEKEKCRQIGIHGLELIKGISINKKGLPVNILTHCNAGWLASIEYGTVTAPIYLAHDQGIPVHIWVDETRPLNQGSRLTAWELGKHGVPYTIIPDNTGGHLMQHGMVDLVLVGSDRTTRKGDNANKVGTYLKALAAFENKIPFYSVLPSSTIDFSISDGLTEIDIEERDQDEVKYFTGFSEGKLQSVLTCPENSVTANFGFDITPAKFITALITEKGICRAKEKDIVKLFSD
jgi:methylthioribose-1-phosphate isomerase